MHISGIVMAENMILIDLRANTANLNTSELSLNLPSIVLAKEVKCVAELVKKSWTPLNGTPDSSSRPPPRQQWQPSVLRLKITEAISCILYDKNEYAEVVRPG